MSNNNQAGQAQPQAAPVFMPTKPKFGDIKEVGTGTWVAWTGGEPKPDWSELQTIAPTSIDPNQYRVSSISGRSKSKYYRVQGLETKFTRTSDLQTFQKKVWKHLVEHGMDTITYLEDPATPTQVVSVIDHHARFEVKAGVRAANLLKTNNTWDGYDLDNIREAKDFLLNSIDDDLEKQLYEVCDDEDTFAAYWLRLIHIVKSVSIDRFDKIKDRIKNRKLSQYAGENIEKLGSDYLADWTELHGAGLYDQNLTMTMLNEIMAAASGSEEAENFRYPLREIKVKLEKKLLDVRHKDYSTAHQEMAADDLDVRSILEAAKDQYRHMLDGGKWPAAAHAKDSKAMNRNYGNANMTLGPKDVEKVVNALIQNDNKANSNKSRGKGHRNGQRQDKKTGNKQFNSRNKSARNNPGRNNTNKVGPPPPKSGESEIKTVDGVKRYWCAKCNRWTLSHTTEQHLTKEELKNQSNKKAGMARVNFNLHPAAYKVCKPTQDTSIKTWTNRLPLILMTIILFVTNDGMSILWEGIKLFSTRVMPIALGLTKIAIGLIQTNTKWIGLTVLGMAIAGIGYKWYLTRYPRETPKPEYKGRIRKGKNYLKKMNRLRKALTRQPRNRRRRPVSVPPVEDRYNRTHHPRFNNLGRQDRYEPPYIECIRLLDQRIEHLESVIHKTKMHLKELEYKLNTYRVTRLDVKLNKKKAGQILRDLHKNIGQSPWVDPLEGALHKLEQQQTVKKETISKKNRSQSTPKKKRNKYRAPLKIPDEPRVTTWRVAMMATFGKMINLSKIGSRTENNMSESVLFDTGANCCVSNRKDDFVGEYKQTNGRESVDGIGKALKIEGQGKVAWTFVADNGAYRTLLLPCYYIPTSNTRIASIRVILKEYPDETVSVNDAGLSLSGSDMNPGITVEFDKETDLPYGETTTMPTKLQANKGKCITKSMLPTTT